MNRIELLLKAVAVGTVQLRIPPSHAQVPTRYPAGAAVCWPGRAAPA